MKVTQATDLYDIFQEIIETVSRKLNTDIAFLYGPVVEIEQTIIGFKNSGDAELVNPFFSIVGNVDIDRGNETSNYGECTINAIIACYSDNKTKAKERIDLNYKSKLEPIYQAILNEIYDCQKFFVSDRRTIQHKQIVNFYYAKQQGDKDNKMILDAIDIKSLKIKLKN